MKIALLYLLTGVGHYREALAVGQELERQGHEVEYINPLDILAEDKSRVAKFFEDAYEWGMNQFTKTMVAVDNLQAKPLSDKKDLHYYWFNLNVMFMKVSVAVAAKLIKPKRDILKYDKVISIHFLATEMFKVWLGRKRFSKIYNVIPDEVGIGSATGYMINNVMNYVTSTEVENRLKTAGLKSKFIKVVGHPLDANLWRNREKIYNRVQESFTKKKLHIGLYIGLFAPMHQTLQTVQILTELSEDIRIGNVKVTLISCNRKFHQGQVNLALKRLKLTRKVNRIYVREPIELVEKGHQMMLKDINVMFSRPSELIFYSLALGIPHIMFNPLGAQEFDMFAHLRKFSDVKFYADIKNYLYIYLSNRDWMKKVSSDLYNSGYNNNGVEGIIKAALAD